MPLGAGISRRTHMHPLSQCICRVNEAYYTPVSRVKVCQSLAYGIMIDYRITL